MTVEVVANIYPAKDKVDVVRDGLKELADKVHKEELGATRYQVYEQETPKDGEAPQFVVVEEYKDQEAYDAHFKTSHFQDLVKRIQEENVMAKELDIKVVKKLGGFLSR